MKRIFSVGLLVAALLSACQPVQPAASPLLAPGTGFGAQAVAGAPGSATSLPAATVAGAGALGAAPAAGGDPWMHRAGYPQVMYPAENPNDEAKAMLGKVLFWDEQLSGDDTVACGTCHRASAGGSDPRSAMPQARLPGDDAMLEMLPGLLSDDIRGGLGVVACDQNGMRTGTSVQVTKRKPPTYFDSMFEGEMFWDGRAGRNFVDPDTGMVLIKAVASPILGVIGGALESQAVGPFMSPVEMACAGATWPKLHAKLMTAVPLARAKLVPADMRQFIDTRGGSYPALFASVFGDTLKVAPTDPSQVINTRRIAFAIATHERRLTSDQTPWDKWNAGDAQAMTPRQVHGYQLFLTKANCQICHTPPMFSDFKFHFLGFHPTQRDPGKGGVTGGLPAENGMMKTPTLRNVGLREPGGLLHQGDGPGHDLASVMQMYNQGGLRGDPAIGPSIDASIFPLGLTPDEIADIIDFMRNALTDPRVKGETAPFDRPRLGSEG